MWAIYTRLTINDKISWVPIAIQNNLWAALDALAMHRHFGYDSVRLGLATPSELLAIAIKAKSQQKGS